MPADPADSNNSKAHFVEYLLDDGSLIDVISLSVICGWIDADAERRAPLAAHVFPDRLDIATVMVSKYGGIGRVREVLTSVQTQHRMPLRSHHTQKIKDIESFKKNVTDPTVLKWLNECIAALERGLEKYRLRWQGTIAPGPNDVFD